MPGQKKFVQVYGMPQAAQEDDISEDIDEEIHTDRDQYLQVPEHVAGITVSQSLGVDPSVDSLAIDDYDHIEPVH
jgi:hypothetical protein